MALTRRQVRDAVRARVATLTTPTAWNESTYHPDLLGRDARSRAHLGWAVRIGASVPARLDRRKRSEGTIVTTTLTVRFLYQMRGSAQVDDAGDALDAESVLIGALTDTGIHPEADLWFNASATPSVLGDGTYVLHEVEVTVGHLLPLDGTT